MESVASEAVVPAHAAPRRSWRPGNRTAVRASGFVVLLALATVAAMVANGRFPGLSSGLISTLDSEGQIGCLSHHSLLATSCPDTGLPVGKHIVLGFAPYWIGALLAKVLGISSHAAFLSVFGLTCALSIVGTVLLLRRFVVSAALGVGAGMLFLIAPSILGLNGFGGTQFGFMLLPLVTTADLWLVESWRDAGWRRRAIVTAVDAIAKVGLLFTDGYSFVACAVLSGCLIVAYFFRRPGWLAAIGVVVAFGLANAIGYAVYSTAFPGSGEFERSPATLFRAMGLDVTTLWIPGPYIWWAQWQHLGSGLSGLAGDTSNALWNYPGMVCVLLAIVGVVLRRRSGAVWSLVGAGIIMLILSFGPSLKVGVDRPAPAPGKSVNFYSLTPAQATVSLPTAVLHEQVPGIDLMRSTYRWFVGTRLVLVVLAGVGTQELLIRARRTEQAGRRQIVRTTAAVLAVAAVVELAPGTLLGTMYRTTDEYRRQISAVSDRINALIPNGSQVVFASGVAVGTPNNYLVDYLAQNGRYTTYNVSEDKDVTVVKERWPDSIRGIITGSRAQVDDAADAFRSGAVDVVVIPFFDIALSAWPPTPKFADAAHTLTNRYLVDQRFRTRIFDDFAIVTPASGS